MNREEKDSLNLQGSLSNKLKKKDESTSSLELEE